MTIIPALPPKTTEPLEIPPEPERIVLVTGGPDPMQPRIEAGFTNQGNYWQLGAPKDEKLLPATSSPAERVKPVFTEGLGLAHMTPAERRDRAFGNMLIRVDVPEHPDIDQSGR